MRQHGDPSKDYAAEWKAWRKERGWTQEQMAEVLDISVQTVCRIERGVNPPNATSREKLAALKRRYREASVTLHEPGR